LLQQSPPANRAAALGELPLATPFVSRSTVHVAWEHSAPVFAIDRLDDAETLALLQALNPDVACVACFPRRMPGALLALPLRIKNNPVGLICLGHGDPEFFREQDIRLLQMLSQQIAISRERSLNQQELRNRNEELEKAQKLLRLAQQRLIDDERLYAVKELSASINHEINNPLSIIVGNVQCLLFVEKNLNEKVIERLNRIETEAMRIAEINHRLLEIDDLVSETYINSGTKLKMLNIEKSSSGVANE